MYNPQVIAKLVTRASIVIFPDMEEDDSMRVDWADPDEQQVYLVGEDTGKTYTYSYGEFPDNAIFYGLQLLNPETCDGSDYC